MNYEKKLKERQKEFYMKLKEEERNKNLVHKEILGASSNKTYGDGFGNESQDGEEDYSKKIDLIMRVIHETKRNKTKNTKLNWIYEGV